MMRIDTLQRLLQRIESSRIMAMQVVILGQSDIGTGYLVQVAIALEELQRPVGHALGQERIRLHPHPGQKT